MWSIFEKASAAIKKTTSAIANFCQHPVKVAAGIFTVIFTAVGATSETAQSAIGANKIEAMLPKYIQYPWRILTYIGMGARWVGNASLKSYFSFKFFKKVFSLKIKEAWQSFKALSRKEKAKKILSFSLYGLINVFGALANSIGTMVGFTEFFAPLSVILLVFLISFAAIDGILTITVEQYFLKKVSEEIKQKSCCRLPSQRYENIDRPTGPLPLEHYEAPSNGKKISWTLTFLLMGGANGAIQAGYSHVIFSKLLSLYKVQTSSGLEVLRYGMMSARVCQSFTFGGAVSASFFHRGFGPVYGKARVATAITLGILSLILIGSAGYIGATSFLNYFGVGLLGAALRILQNGIAIEMQKMAHLFSRQPPDPILPSLNQ